jgi:CDP-6-deoxy-D-xylo-4-hexulose-3-dehydrase
MFRVGVGGFEFGPEERQYLNQVIDNNQLSYGPLTQQFERQIASLHDSRFGVFMNSGTSALHIALAALKQRNQWQDGDEVIVPATTFVATANIVLHNNLKPVFVDVDPTTYNIDASKIEAAISNRTRCIIPVHLLGLPCDMDEIVSLAKKYHLSIIEDSCETMFATYKGKPVGSFGDIGVFSTYVAHFIVTGIGGMAVTRDPELAVLMRSLMNHGRDGIYMSTFDDDDLVGDDLHQVVERRFNFVNLGHSFRATEMEAALGLGQLAKVDTIISQRRKNAEYYMNALKPLENEIQIPFIPEDRTHAFMLYPIVLKKGHKRDLINHLEDHGIETRDLLPLVNQPIYKKLGYELSGDQFPISWNLIDRAFYIGCHQYLEQEHLDYVVSQITSYFEGRATGQ